MAALSVQVTRSRYLYLNMNVNYNNTKYLAKWVTCSVVLCGVKIWLHFQSYRSLGKNWNFLHF